MQTHKRNPRPSGNAGEARETERQRDPAGDGLAGDPVVSELRKLYDGIVEEPVPDHLVELLRKLDEVERKR